MERPVWAPKGVDLSTPSVSRMYDYYLGGSHNFEADRTAARQAIEAFPGLPKIMQANRAFMRRAVRYAIEQGITQFLDIGSGVPTFGNVHEVAHGACDRARVVYVDNDPVAVAHSQAVLEGDPHTTVVAADVRAPHDVLNHYETQRMLDFQQPVALLLVALLHFIEDSDNPGAILAEFRDRLAPGSLLVISHASTEGSPRTPEQGDAVSRVYRDGGSSMVLRDRREVEAFFEGFDIIAPGLVTLPHWRPEGPTGQEDPATFTGIAGAGRKA